MGLFTVSLPTSKSISNRLLMLKHIFSLPLQIEALSDADDTKVLKSLLETIKTDGNLLDVSNCGTAFRFLLPYLAWKKGEWLIIGDRRMAERPIDPLVSELELWGAKIEKPDCNVLELEKTRRAFLSANLPQTAPISDNKVPLLHITGAVLHPRDLYVDLSQSSQFLSALMMAAPLSENPVTFYFQPRIHSMPYLKMTAAIMLQLGFQVEMGMDKVTVFPFKNNSEICNIAEKTRLRVASDWSSAAFWWVWASLQPTEYCLRVNGIQFDDNQADSCVVSLLEPFGVSTVFDDNGALVEKKAVLHLPEKLCFDANDSPDLVPLIVSMCCLKQIPALVKNVENLRYKESDRILALKGNLDRWMDFSMEENDLILAPLSKPKPPFCFDSYMDHRITMALALFVTLQSDLRITDRDVVSKSYPSFWQQLEKIVK